MPMTRSQRLLSSKEAAPDVKTKLRPASENKEQTEEDIEEPNIETAEKPTLSEEPPRILDIMSAQATAALQSNNVLPLPKPPPLSKFGIRPAAIAMQPMQTVQTPVTMIPAVRPAVRLANSPSLIAPSPRNTVMLSPATMSQSSAVTLNIIAPETLTEEDIEKRQDKASIKGIFGWETLDGVSVPIIFRKGIKFVSVRMTEKKLLSKFPSKYPEELKKRPPIVSQFITSFEAKLLNEINVEHCASEFGAKPFTEKELIVCWKDFTEFYHVVKKHFPTEKVVKRKKGQVPPFTSIGGSWVQINNTVVPYIKRHMPSQREIIRLAPLPVIKYGAGLLTDVQVPSLPTTEDESKLLTQMCKTAGLDFTFSTSTALVLLNMLPVYCSEKVVLKQLPDNDPFGNAEYCVELGSGSWIPKENMATEQSSKIAVLPQNPKPIRNTGDPSQRQVGVKSPTSTLVGPDPKRQKVDLPALNVTAPLGLPTVPSSVALSVYQSMLPTVALNSLQAGKPPVPQNPIDMQTLGQIMNMQASILAGQPFPFMQPPLQISGQLAPGVTFQQIPPVCTTQPPTLSAPKPKPNPMKIQPVVFQGKKVSCLMQGGPKDRLALLEAISRVFFPNQTLKEFVTGVVDVLQAPVRHLSREEEKAFINFYGLPTKSLKCNRALRLEDLEQLMPQLKYMFKDKTTEADEQNVGTQKSVLENSLISPNGSNDHAGDNIEDQEQQPSKEDSTNNDNLTKVSTKTAPKGSKKLEDMVNKLRKNVLKELDSQSVTSDSVGSHSPSQTNQNEGDSETETANSESTDSITASEQFPVPPITIAPTED